MGNRIWWIASYPKSGNTWVRAVLAVLVSGQPPDINAMTFLGGISCDRARFDEALGISSADLSLEQETDLRPRAYESWAAEAEHPSYCKAHDAYHLTPAGEPLFPTAATRGAVYLVRDPRAVAVSLAYHRAQPIDEAIATLNDPAAAFSNSRRRLPIHLRQRLLRWGEHVESWLSVPFPIHVVRYEDMMADPHAAFIGMAAFLDLPHDPKTIAAAVEMTTFARLQAQEREAGFVEKPRQASAFFREGSVDGWRRVLTPEQAGRVVTSHGAVMRRLGYDLTVAPIAARGAA